MLITSASVACSRLSDSGEDAKVKGAPSFLPFFFLFALSQFRGPDYLGAWNRLALQRIKQTYLEMLRGKLKTLSSNNSQLKTTTKIGRKYCWFAELSQVQWNLDITNLFIQVCITRLGTTNDFLYQTSKYMKRNLDMTKLRYSKRILPVSWPFAITRFHWIRWVNAESQ